MSSSVKPDTAVSQCFSLTFEIYQCLEHPLAVAQVKMLFKEAEQGCEERQS